MREACSAPSTLARLTLASPRLSERLAARQPITIVAIGSSSTAGAGASSAAASYPSRLEAELQRLFPGIPIRVVNRGVNGEETKDMLARFDTSVIAERPDLVLWQVGTNSVLRDRNLTPVGTLLHEGIERIRATGAEVILINPQFAPKVLAKPHLETMLSLINATAKGENVPMFDRYAVMRHWQQGENLPFEAFLSPDGLHMNDWSYGCLATLVAGSLNEALRRGGGPAIAGMGAQARR
jgi:lysophospholipase L1-like esterase